MQFRLISEEREPPAAGSMEPDVLWRKTAWLVQVNVNMLSHSDFIFSFLKAWCPDQDEVLQLSPCIKLSGAKQFSFCLFIMLMFKICNLL